MEPDKPEISVESISFPKEGGYRYEVVLRATQYSKIWSYPSNKTEERKLAEAVFTVWLSRGKRRKTEKPITDLRKEAREAIAIFCEAIISTLSPRPKIRV